jgi:hypothetical protein
MMVEHTFVTTSTAPAALSAASELLAALRFEPTGPLGETSREWRRGRPTAARARGLSDLPQRIRIDFDRGRVSVAGSLEVRHQRQLRAGEPLVAITVALENLLARGQPFQTSVADAAAKQAKIARIDRRHQIILWTCLGTPVVLGLAALAFFTLRDISKTSFGPARAHAAHTSSR